MKTLFLLAAVSGAMALSGCESDGYGYGRPGYDNRPAVSQSNRRGNRNVRANRDRDGRYLGANDQIYRDRNGNYYCKRSDGTTGAIVGALGGGVLGNIIAPGGSKTLGTILGAGGGLLAGRAIDRNNIRCE